MGSCEEDGTGDGSGGRGEGGVVKIGPSAGAEWMSGRPRGIITVSAGAGEGGRARGEKMERRETG